MANTTYVFSAYPDGNTNTSTCTFSAISANKRTNIVQDKNNKGIFVGSTKAKAIYKGNVQIWPEVKTLTFKNMTIGLPSVSLPKTVAVEHLLFFQPGSSQNHYMDAWSWGSDLVKEGNTYYFKAQNYAQPVMVCDVYFENTSNKVPLATGNIITLNGSNIQMEWCTYDNIKVSCSPAVSDLGTHFCYLKGVSGKAKLYLSCGAMANAYIKNPYTNEISLLSQCLPLEKPENVTISRSSQNKSFSLYSGSNNGIETNITVNGVSGRTILKRYPLYFGFVNQPANSSSSTPYTSYILEDENNIAYIPFRYVFNGCSWNPSCISYTIEKTWDTYFKSTTAGTSKYIKLIQPKDYQWHSTYDNYKIKSEESTGENRWLHDTFTSIAFIQRQGPTNCNNCVGDFVTTPLINNLTKFLSIENISTTPRIARVNDSFTGHVGVKHDHPNFSYAIQGNRAKKINTVFNTSAKSWTNVARSSWVNIYPNTAILTPATYDGTSLRYNDARIYVSFNIPFTLRFTDFLDYNHVTLTDTATVFLTVYLYVNGDTLIGYKNYGVHQRGGDPNVPTGGWTDHWGDSWRDSGDKVDGYWQWPEHTMSGSFYINDSSLDHTPISSVSLYIGLNAQCEYTSDYLFSATKGLSQGWSDTGGQVKLGAGSVTITVLYDNWAKITLGKTTGDIYYYSNGWSNPIWHNGGNVDSSNINNYKISFTTGIADDNILYSTDLKANSYYEVYNANNTYLSIAYVGVHKKSNTQLMIYKYAYNQPLTTQRYVSKITRNYTLK